VFFSEYSSDLISGFVDANGQFASDLYRYDRDTGIISLVSGQNNSASVGANGESSSMVANDDGSIVAWTTVASNLSATVIDTNGNGDVYARDLSTGSIQPISKRVGPTSVTAGGQVDWLRQSADGRFVVFTSTANNLVAGQASTVGIRNVFLTD